MLEWTGTCSQAPCNKSEQSQEVELKGCDLGTRERRSRPRMSDIVRTVDKHLGPIPSADPELAKMLDTIATPDKNTPESLKQLRWAIYEAIERYEANISKTISGCIKMEVESLFKEYTNS